MNRNLLENNYLIIPNFITSYRANKLKEEFIKFSEENFLSGDEQSPNSKCLYNYVSFLEILCEKTPRVSDILEETVIPTYSYARVYKNGSTLDPHVDRDACEISLTLHLGGDSPWPINIKTPSGKDQSIILNPGEAMMYLGCEASHWREKYKGEEYVQVFLHYVRSRGDKFYAYFDKEKTNNFLSSSNLNKENESIVENKNNTSLSLDVVDKDVKEEYTNIRPDNKLEDFIQVFDNVLSDDICDRIVEEYSNSFEWNHSTVDNNSVNFDIRKCDSIPISHEFILSNNLEYRKNLDNLIYESVKKAKDRYLEKFKNLYVTADTGYDLLKYEEGDFYIQHTDSCGTTSNRIISCSIQLNDDYDGGEFAFFNREMMIRSKKGSMIMFPSNFMFPHEIMPIIRGTRYAIITWFI
jgi:predicted 2-oxoglutarate/Fe(II)-dependent dioxygenase YbiX